MMRKLLIWYLPQAALFAFGLWFGIEVVPQNGGPQLGGPGLMIGALLLPAAYTGGVNLLMDLSRHWNARRARRQ